MPEKEPALPGKDCPQPEWKNPLPGRDRPLPEADRTLPDTRAWLIDLSRPLLDGMPVYPGDPPVSVETVSRFPEAAWQLTRISLGCHSGTHVDAPRHFLPAGATLEQIALDRFCGPARLADLPPAADGCIDATALTAADVRPGECLLIRTGWQPQPGADLSDCPAFRPGSGANLARLGIRLLALDLPTVAEAGEATGDMHRTLLASGIAIVEGLAGLDKLAAAAAGGRAFEFFAVPLLIPGSEASPVRAFARFG